MCFALITDMTLAVDWAFNTERSRISRSVWPGDNLQWTDQRTDGQARLAQSRLDQINAGSQLSVF